MRKIDRRGFLRLSAIWSVAATRLPKFLQGVSEQETEATELRIQHMDRRSPLLLDNLGSVTTVFPDTEYIWMLDPERLGRLIKVGELSEK